jgi:hypothetical protein
MTKKELIEIIKDLPEETEIMFLPTFESTEGNNEGNFLVYYNKTTEELTDIGKIQVIEFVDE